MNVATGNLSGISLDPLSGGWDFHDASPDALAGIHPYPAKFIPELPRRLIEAFPPPAGSLIMDPFCGSGTALVETQVAGLSGIGIDLNPIATMMSRVKTSSVPRDAEKALRDIVDIVMTGAIPPVPDIPRLDHWFQPDVQDVVAAILSAIGEAGGGATDVMRLALSSILVRISNQDSDTRYAAIHKKVQGRDVLPAFCAAVSKTVAALKARRYPLTRIEVIEGDLLSFDPKPLERRVGLVVTSPPYPNAYEYWLYHKYRMWWLGYDAQAVKEREIGARAHFFKGANSHTAASFDLQMRNVLATLACLVMQGGHACFVIGRSRIHGALIDNAEIIARAAIAAGFIEVLRTERVINRQRKSFNLSHASIKTETVLILRRLPY